ncbi:DUF1524 domain-containing protein [Streptomyces sp. NPDC058268]|uniref:GmrSD restriction endonuclease domain-containing protein n=1 Tax=Streptomyces sp. NPDC058268 TaxID=3346413 RepID=UPI0036E15F1F
MATRASSTLTGAGVIGALVLVLTFTNGTVNPAELLDRIPGRSLAPAHAAGPTDSKPGGPGPGAAYGKVAIPTTTAVARTHLAALPVAAEHAARPYDRDRFQHWSPARDFGWSAPPGCDTREAALIRDGQHVTTGAGCKVTGGRWFDPYTGATYTQARQLDLDHVVPLGEVWRSGADTWTDTRREQYANSPDVVMSVDRGENRAKGDKDPAHWQPDNRAYTCGYAIKWISIKYAWKLRVDPAEKHSLETALDTCR